MVKAALIIGGSAIAAITVIMLVYVVGAPLSEVLAIGFGAVSLFWLLVLLTVPWNLYFQARGLIREIAISRKRGIDVPQEREAEARRICRRMAWIAVGAHLLSAAVIAVITYFSGLQVGYYFAGFYLVSTLFRPAAAYFTQLRKLLDGMLREVKYPREDVAELRSKVQRLEQTTKSMGNTVTDLAARQERFARQLNTDNKEVMAGLRTLLRLSK